MTQRNEHIDLIMDELERYGLRGELSERGKHLEIAWTTPVGRRFVIVARTPSDWRAGLNTRSEVRKLLRADNMQLRAIHELSFQKAMTLPKQQMINQDQVLRNDVSALMDMVFDLQTQISQLQDQNSSLINKMNSMTVVSRIEFNHYEEEKVDDIIVEVNKKIYEQEKAPFLLGSTQDSIIACLTHQYQSLEDIVKASGVGKKYVCTTLSKAKKRGFAENGLYGQWKRK